MATLPTIAECEAECLSIGQAADRLGTLKCYDTALPIVWCDDMKARIGEWPRYFVWGYDFTDGRRYNWGIPVPLVQEAAEQLVRYNVAAGTHYGESF